MSDMNALEWQYYETTRAEVLPFIPENVRKLLDVGCGKGAFGAHLKSQRDIEIHGIEINATAAARAAQRLDQVFTGDLERNRDLIAQNGYDCVTLLDVLEHLQDPWTLLRETAGWLSGDGVVVASIPNLRYYPVLKEILLEKSFRYRDYGVMDRTHLRFFTESTVRELFSTCGFEIESLTGINGEAFPWKWGLLNKLCKGALEDTRFMQFMVVARPAR